MYIDGAFDLFHAGHVEVQNSFISSCKPILSFLYLFKFLKDLIFASSFQSTFIVIQLVSESCYKEMQFVVSSWLYYLSFIAPISQWNGFKIVLFCSYLIYLYAITWYIPRHFILNSMFPPSPDFGCLLRS